MEANVKVPFTLASGGIKSACEILLTFGSQTHMRKKNLLSFLALPIREI